MDGTNSAPIDQTRGGENGLRILLVTRQAGQKSHVLRWMDSVVDAHSTQAALPNKQALKKACRLRPQLILLGDDLEEFEGMEAARLILESSSDCRILALTKGAGRRYAAALLGVGVLGVVRQNGSRPEWRRAVTQVLMGHPFVSPAILKRK